MRTNWLVQTPRTVQNVSLGRLMPTRTLALHALYAQLARRTQPHDPSTLVHATDAIPDGGLIVKEWRVAQIVKKGATVARTILMDACRVMHRKGLSVKVALDTLAQRLDILQSSWLPTVVATRRSCRSVCRFPTHAWARAHLLWQKQSLNKAR